MSIKFLLSELSPKVKAYNLIEESILQRRLDIYQKEQRANVRMIEKDLKNFKQEQDERDYLMKTLSKSNSILSNDNNHEKTIYLPSSEQKHVGQSTSNKVTSQKKRQHTRKKKRQKNAWVEEGFKPHQHGINDERLLFSKSHNETVGSSGSDYSLKETRHSSNSAFFLPKLHLTHTATAKSSTPNSKYTKEPLDFLILPPINKTSLTSSNAIELPKVNTRLPHTK